MKCCVLGLGYIGLPTAALLADYGHTVLGVDIDQAVVATVNSGNTHFLEPKLDEVVQRAVNKGSLVASLQPDSADVYIIAVPTPFTSDSQGNPQPDLTYVFAAATSIAPFLSQDSLVVLESTCPVGTTEKLHQHLLKLAFVDILNIAYCPERVLPGRILDELVSNDRVIGGNTPSATALAISLYSSFTTGTLHTTNAKTAELVKLTENSYRDVNIAFANELSLICSEAEVNVYELIGLTNKHPRVNVLTPGCGVGGHCIAVDPWFLVSAFPSITTLISSARHVNDSKSLWVIKQVLNSAQELEAMFGRKIIIGCMGLSFKPDVDDLRESPALSIATQLSQSHHTVLCCEPHITHHPNIALRGQEEVLKSSDLIVYLVSHSSFKHSIPTHSRILDFCGVTH